MIRLTDASFGYWGVPALSGVNLEISRRDFLLITGPNGSGKSTLLRGISRLLNPLSGKVEREGVRFGYVPQLSDFNLPLSITALELVSMGASVRLPWWKTVLRNRDRELCNILRDCAVEELADRSYTTLSGGQRQRVLLARALATRPDFLILDEPTAGVDQAMQIRLAEMLGQRRYRDGQDSLGIILVTHEPAPFLSVANRFVIVEQGRLRSLTASEIASTQSHLGQSYSSGNLRMNP